MTEFKQFHSGDETSLVFHSQSQIYFCQCDAKHTLSFFELLRILSDAAVEDYNQRGMSWKMLWDHGYLILLSRQSFHFHKMPHANQKITIRTWEEKPQVLQFVRAYEITDTETGELLVSGLSNWLLVCAHTHRILRLKDFTLRPDSVIQTEYKYLEPSKISVPENVSLLCERTIWYSDIDGNGHTNNARYGAFVIDSLPDEYQKKTFSDFKINYSKEAVLGHKIQIYGAFDDNAKKITIIGKQDENICFEAELYWN